MTIAPGTEIPPERALAAFGVESEPTRLPGSPVWRCGGIVLRPVTDRARVTWLAHVLQRVEAPALRVAYPVRASDGRFIVGGWAASRYLSGRPECRYDEIIPAALRLARALTGEPRPGFPRQGADVLADRIAWEEADVPINERRGGRWFEVLAVARRQVRLPNQVGLLRQWSHLPEWPQLLLRALLFRLAGHALNPRSTASALDGLRGAAGAVSEIL